MLADELTTSSASTRTWTSTSWRSAATAFLDRRGRDPTLGEPVEQARSDEVAPVVGAQHDPAQISVALDRKSQGAETLRRLDAEARPAFSRLRRGGCRSSMDDDSRRSRLNELGRSVGRSSCDRRLHKNDVLPTSQCDWGLRYGCRPSTSTATNDLARPCEVDSQRIRGTWIAGTRITREGRFECGVKIGRAHV